MSINTNTLKASKTYKVEIEFTLDKDTRETALDRMFEDAMYCSDITSIIDSDISEYEEVVY